MEKKIIKIKFSTAIILIILIITTLLLVTYVLIKKYKINYDLSQANKIVTTKNYTNVITNDISSYKGVWQFFANGSTEIPETELIINKIDDGKINFNIEMYRLTEFENVTGIISGDTVSFNAVNVNGWKIEGKLILNNNIVKLNIEKSSIDNIKTGEIFFKQKSDKSILK